MATTCMASHRELERAPVAARSTAARPGGAHGVSGRTGWRTTLATALGLLATYALLATPGLGLGATDPAPSTTPTTSARLLEAAASPRDAIGVSYGPLPEQMLDLHLPSGVAGPFAVVLFAHAGGWIAGTRSAVPDVISTLIADVGVAVVSIDYRLIATAPDGSYTNTFPTASFDVDRAIRFVRANAQRWDLDPDRIIVAGA